jgi:carboxyl-terminal processing protease
MMVRLSLAFVLLLVLILGAPTLACSAAGSIGVQVVPISTGELSVLHVIDASPAEQIGLLPGDLIIEVNGESLQGSDFDQVSRESLWGEVGSEVSLVWLRPGLVGPMQATLKRAAKSATLKIEPTPGVKLQLPR